MLRYVKAIGLALGLAFACCGFAAGAEGDLTGIQADYTLAVKVGPDLLRHAMQASGLTGGEPPDLPTVTTGGTTVWSGPHMRSEVRSPHGILLATVIVDTDRRRALNLDPFEHTAEVAELKTGPMDMLAGGQGLGAATEDYASILASVKAMTGTTLRELGARTVDGYACHGLQFTIDLQQYRGEILAAAAAQDAQPNSAGLTALLDFMQSASVELWVSDEYNVAVELHLAISDLTVDLQRSRLRRWSGPAQAFAVPAGYLVVDRQHPGFGMRQRVPLVQHCHLPGA